MSIQNSRAEFLIRQLKVLLVEDNAFMRGIARTLLSNIGVAAVLEAGDGIAALETLRLEHPALVLLDWEMPLLNGPEFVRIVRSPGVFPTPDIPIVMMSGHVDRARVDQAARLGVNEFLCKPLSATVLRERIVSILLNPRASVRIGNYYGPAPRKRAAGGKLDSPPALDVASL